MSKTPLALGNSALRISPLYTSDDWQALNQQSPSDWPVAVTIVRDRLYGRFLSFADRCLLDDYSGFVVLAIDCLLVETIQQFIEGKKRSKKSGEVFGRFLERRPFQPYFGNETVRNAFYYDIRCGLLHQAEAKNKWLVLRNQDELLKTVAEDGYIIDVEQFHAALKESLEDYLTQLCKPENAEARANLWKKMGYICNARIARGAFYEKQAENPKQ
jgi:hypothetical protein